MKKDLKLIYYSPGDSFEITHNYAFTEIQKGKEHLVNTIVKRLLTVQGSNLYSPRFGDSPLSLFTPISNTEEENLKSTIALSVKDMLAEIKQEQKLNTSLQPEEKLVNLTLTSTEFNNISGTWSISLDITLGDGTQTTVSI
jgi:hypothetical protein